MITIKKGSLMYGAKTILSEIDLTIKKGEFIVICGESGSGKSSLIRILNGLIPELYEGEIAGEFNVLGSRLPVNDFNEYVKELGVVFQNPKTQFFMNDVYSELAFSMENNGETQELMKAQIKKISNELNIASFWQRSMHELSGGEKQRVAFSSACIMPRQLFLLDEPSSNLDEKHIKLIQEYLLWLKKQQQTIIVAEHRLYYLMPLVDRFLFMKDGRITKEFTKSEIERLKTDEVKKLGLRSLVSSQFLFNERDSESHSNQNVLTCENVNFSYKKNHLDVSIQEVSFTSNEVTAIIGENGAGKTTLSHLLTGLLKPKSGNVSYNGMKQTPKQLIKKSFLVTQNVNLQLFFETVEKEIMAKAKRQELKETVINTLNLSDLLKRHPQTLSGGQKQRVAIATAILSGKEIIVMDEPTSGLDLKHMLEVRDVIKKIKSFNCIIIIISHDKEFINNCCDRFVELEKGMVV